LAKSSGDNVCLSASTPRSSKSAKPHFSADAIDADKEGYVDYLNQLLPLVRPGGNADLDTVFYTQGEGMGVTLKKR
jgi:predicted O-methyltransferase YrrM